MKQTRSNRNGKAGFVILKRSHCLEVAEVPDARRQCPGQAVVGHLAAAPARNETKQNTVTD